MTLKKVPNVDDIKTFRFINSHEWVWAGQQTSHYDRGVAFDATANGSISHLSKHVKLSTDGTADEYAEAQQGYRIEGRERGIEIINIAWKLGGNASNMGEDIEIGFSRFQDYDDNNIAVIQPTSTRFRVDNGGNDKDVDISTALDKTGIPSEYCSYIIKNYDAGEILCYVDDDPFRPGSSPDATVASVPNTSGVYVKIHGNGDGADAGDVVYAISGSWAWIP